MSVPRNQRLLPFNDPKEEARLERCRRILSGELGHKLKRASEMHFDFDRATEAATEVAANHHTPRRRYS